MVPLEVVGLLMVCTGIVKVPVALNPVSVAGFAVAVQEKVAPETFEVNVTKLVGLPEQTDWVSGLLLTDGFGLTVITWVMGVPVQPLAVGVMVMVTVPGELVLLVNVHEGTGLAVPLGAAPEIPGDDTVAQL